MLKVLLLLLALVAVAGNPRHSTGAHHGKHGGVPRGRGGGNFTLPRSITELNTVDTPKRFSVVSMAVSHHSDVGWHVPALHDKYSIGWNRTFAADKMLRPYACTLRFYAMGLEKVLEPFMKGGTGYLGLEVNTATHGPGGKREVKEDKEQEKKPAGKGKTSWHGFDKVEALKAHCYYMTNKGYGSEFVDDPKTLGIAVYCPIALDVEVGEYGFRKIMEPGFFCRSLADYAVKAELYLRPTDFHLVGKDQDFLQVLQNSASAGDPTVLSKAIDAAAVEVAPRELRADFTTLPAAPRLQDVRLAEALDPRPHAVCTVQTFRNNQTGPMLYAFVQYYLALGWRVIVYDRFGLHREFMADLAGLEGVEYHPFTVFQLVNPNKYNDEYAKAQGVDRKVFYQMEKNWGYKGKKADTADQDQDKSKTYDYARIEYAHLDMILYVDADELLYCPQAVQHGLDSQRNYQQKIMQSFSAQGVEEMRFVRIPYSGRAPKYPGFNGTKEELWEKDFTENTEQCMLNSYAKRDVAGLIGCWSSASGYDNFPKSADFGSVCPFHYNHWSCDGMRNGGRDYVATRCRCKVSFDMINGFEYKPMLKRCHLMHFNDNKYKFQVRREKHANDHGSIDEINPIVTSLYAKAGTAKTKTKT